MAYRAPRLMLLHAARTAGAAALSTPAGTFAAGSTAALVDDRALPLATWTTSGTGREIRLDRGAGTLEAIDRLIVPAGHNLASFTSIAVDADDNAGFATPTTLLAPVAVAAGVISQTLTSSSERYVRFTIGGTGTPELGELVYSRTRATTGVLDPGWSDLDEPNVEVLATLAGVEARIARPARRRFAFAWRWQAASGVLDELLTAAAAGAVLWLDPPDDTEPPLPVVVTRASRAQDAEVPGAMGLSYSYAIELQEVLG